MAPAAILADPLAESAPDALILDGLHLTIADVINVSLRPMKLQLDEAALTRVAQAHNIVLDKARSNEKIYGLNTGVGQNKDIIIPFDEIEAFNRNLIYTHLVAVGDNIPEGQSRAVLLVKLNSFLRGNAGISPEIVVLIRDMLERGISPVMKATSSIGESDLGTLAFLGLVLIGEGQVYYHGAIRETRDVFAEENLAPVILGPKDALSIVSSNAYSQALTALTIGRINELLSNAELVYALSLEAVDGNITPIVCTITQTHWNNGAAAVATRVYNHLEGSYLLDGHHRTTFQDPLSFRNFVSVQGALADAVSYLRAIAATNLTVSDENPYVDVEKREIFSTSNFDTTGIALALEMVNTALSQLARTSTFRTIKLGDPSFTGLARFLSANDHMLGFQALQKTAVSLEVQIHDLTHTATNNFYPISAGVEDYATNLLLIVNKTLQIIAHFRYVLSIEALSAAQAIDLRGHLALGAHTRTLYERIRSVVPFLDHDDNLSARVEGIKNEIFEPIF